MEQKILIFDIWVVFVRFVLMALFPTQMATFVLSWMSLNYLDGLFLTWNIFGSWWTGWQRSTPFHDIWWYWIPSGDFERGKCILSHVLSYSMLWYFLIKEWFCLNFTFKLIFLLVAGAISAPEQEHMSYAALLICYWHNYTCNYYTDFWSLQNGWLEPFLGIF